MGCSNSKSSVALSSGAMQPARASQPGFDVLAQCSACEAAFQLRLPPDTSPGARVQLRCPNCGKRTIGSFGDVIRELSNNRSVRAAHDEAVISEADMEADIQLAMQLSLKEAGKQVVNDLPRERYDARRHQDLELECQICLEEWEDGVELIRLPCMHAFHAKCGAEWLQKSQECPTCSHKVAAHLEDAANVANQSASQSANANATAGAAGSAAAANAA